MTKLSPLVHCCHQFFDQLQAFENEMGRTSIEVSQIGILGYDLVMQIRNLQLARQFAEQHPDSQTSLSHFIAVVRSVTWRTPAARLTFPKADYLGHDRWIFNIGGNKYRLLAFVHIRDGMVTIIKIMTHAQYDKERF